MSDFADALFELLPLQSSLQDKNNEGHKVIEDTIGSWFDNFNLFEFYNGLFLNDATGKYLDLFGKDYGVTRQSDEDDESFRTRIIQEKLDYLTPNHLKTVFGLHLYNYIPLFDVKENVLTSDNVYIGNKYMCFNDVSLHSVLDKKFVLDDVIIFVDEIEGIDYIINTSDDDVLIDYLEIYNMDIIDGYFAEDETLKRVKLNLPNVNYCGWLFGGCSNLIDVKLTIPSVIGFGDIFYDCDKIEKINVKLPANRVEAFKNYVLSLNLLTLTDFIINGERVI